MTFTPENDVERALMKAAEDRANEPAFYQALLAADLFVIGEMGADRQLSIHSLTYQGREYPALFSSVMRLKAFTRQDEVPHVSMKGRDLFETTRGAGFILNPASDYGKELLPDEIANLLDGGKPRQMVFDRPQSALIGQPKVWPTALVDALKAAFEKQKTVVAAYLIQISYQGSDTPHPMIGVEVDGAWEPVSEAMDAAIQASGHQGAVDGMKIERGDDNSMSGALLKTTPFYTRKKR